MRLFLFRFWPVLIPLLIYWLWLKHIGHRATIEGRPVLRFSEGPWYWALLASLLVAVGCFIFWGIEATVGTTGAYVPPHLEGGQVVPGQVKKP